ncbi:MAG TPA: HEAT repeat domain-containing protein [Candidatus Binatia bacterium]|nr:HEAT repeat domain-containing protein [Candidatus Binatia bacterium]
MKVLIVLVSVMLVAEAEAAMVLPKNKLLVEFEHERLSVSAGDIALRDLLSEVQAKSGIAIDLKNPEAAARQYSADFKNVPPVLALQMILQDFNFAFFHAETRLMRVLILPAEIQTLTANSKLMKANSVGRLAEAENPPLKRGTTPRLSAGNSQDSDVMAKLDAIATIEDSDDATSIAALGEALTDRHTKVKVAALRALAAKKAESVTEKLRLGLKDPDPEFRIEVLEILAERGDLDSLRKALADRNQEVRDTAADLLWNATAHK